MWLRIIGHTKVGVARQKKLLQAGSFQVHVRGAGWQGILRGSSKMVNEIIRVLIDEDTNSEQEVESTRLQNCIVLKVGGRRGKLSEGEMGGSSCSGPLSRNLAYKEPINAMTHRPYYYYYYY